MINPRIHLWILLVLDLDIKSGYIDGQVISMYDNISAMVKEFSGKWAGDDLEECLEAVIASRGEAEF